MRARLLLLPTLSFACIAGAAAQSPFPVIEPVVPQPTAYAHLEPVSRLLKLHIAPKMPAASNTAGTPVEAPVLAPMISVAGRVHIQSDISVTARPGLETITDEYERVSTPRDMETTAGTFGDPSRYLQTMAGVTNDNDQRNDFLVRGGNPSENLFVIDGIEIPSINQLALSDTTGGFVSMLDADAIQTMVFHTDAYDSKYEQRLSSVVDISTRPTGPVQSHRVSEFGLAGAGGSMTRPMGENGSLFVSGRRSVLNLFTDDIGMNGVPIYTNGFVRAENRIDERNNWWGISLTGVDSIAINPSATDGAETNPFNILYSGWRNTTGVNWQHDISPRSFGVLSVARAQQNQTVVENDQLQDGQTVYNENTGDGITTVKYDWVGQMKSWATLSAGVRASLDQLHYAVAQPLGLQNPYSADPTPLNATAMNFRFATFASSAYGQVSIAMPHAAKLVLGESGQEWALGGHASPTGKALLTLPLFGHEAHFGYAQYAQMPSTLYLLSFNNLKTLDPIDCHQFVAGTMLFNKRHVQAMLDTYQKRYSNYPVAANFPQLSLANIADTFGQAFLMFPMVSTGRGIANGAELTVESQPTSRLKLTGTLAYARSWYSGLDGVLRRGSFDLPLTSNLTGLWHIGRGYHLSWRYSTATGKPYTPDNMPLSTAQNRDVYDLTQLNAVRAPAYSRLDFRFEQTRTMRHGVMTWHVGLENALGAKNFYAYAWQPHWTAGGVAEQDQMPRFPDGGVKMVF